MSIQHVENPARCRNCGRELANPAVNDPNQLCPDCRAQAGLASETSVAYGSPPQRIVVRQRSFPITKTLVGINFAVFLLMTLGGASPVEPSPQQLIRWGADFGPLALSTQPWRALTSNYVHIGIIHIALNMWCLWNLGFLAEVIFDRLTYVLAYTACGIAGSVASLWWHPLTVGAGASGAIFGLAGALITALYLGNLPIPKAALKGTLKSLLSFAGYNLVFGAIGHSFIDNSAHIGGLIMGLGIGAAMAPHLTNAEERNRWRILVFGVIAIVLVAGLQYAKKVNTPVIRHWWQTAYKNASLPQDDHSSQPNQ